MARRGRGGRRPYILVILVLASVTLITLDQRDGDSGPVGTLGRVAHRVVSPVSDLTSSALNPVSDWFDGVVHDGSLKRDNARLKRDLAAARIEAARNHSALKQNQLLTELDGQPYLDDIPSVVARIVATSPGNFGKSITLDRGSERGIKVGMPVVASDGLVGRITQVWQGGCTVLLLDDPNFAVGVRTVDTRVTGAASGQAGRSALDLQLAGPLRPAKRPRAHEDVETSGEQGTTFPPGIPVGTVETVKPSDDDLTVDVRIDPFVDVADLLYVKVLRWTPGSPVPPKLHATTTTPTTTTTTTTTAAGATTSSTAPGSTTTGP